MEIYLALLYLMFYTISTIWMVLRAKYTHIRYQIKGDMV